MRSRTKNLLTNEQIEMLSMAPRTPLLWHEG